MRLEIKTTLKTKVNKKDYDADLIIYQGFKGRYVSFSLIAVISCSFYPIFLSLTFKSFLVF